jgi:hypothetical protein
MKCDQIEELLFTDREVLREMEESQKRYANSKRRRPRGAAALGRTEDVTGDRHRESEKADACLGFESPLPWRFVIREYTGEAGALSPR